MYNRVLKNCDISISKSKTNSSSFLPLIEESIRDSRDLIMPHQKDAVDAMISYYKLEQDIPDRNGLVVMPTGSGKTYTAVNWLLSDGIVKGYRVVWLVHRHSMQKQLQIETEKDILDEQLQGMYDGVVDSRTNA